MSVVNTKSTAITNADATPVTRNGAACDGARILIASATLSVVSTDSDNSVYRFIRIPSNATVHKIDLFNDAIPEDDGMGGDTASAYDFGFYQTSANGGAVVDQDVYASAVDLASARVAPLDITHYTLDINKATKKVWEILALTSDSGREYDLCATGTTVGKATGDITLKVYYTI